MAKKALVPVENGDLVRGKAFALPAYRDGLRLLKVPKGTQCDVAAVVYTGREILPSDIVARMVQNGIETGLDEAAYLELTKRYLSEISRFKIGNFVRLNTLSEGFELTLVDKKTL